MWLSPWERLLAMSPRKAPERLTDRLPLHGRRLKARLHRRLHRAFRVRRRRALEEALLLEHEIIFNALLSARHGRLREAHSVRREARNPLRECIDERPDLSRRQRAIDIAIALRR